MSKYEFYEGQQLKAIYHVPTPMGEGVTSVGVNGVISITVCMENGQMAGVPWARVTDERDLARKFNLALVGGVEEIEGEKGANG